MTFADFNVIMAKFQELENKISLSKGTEYANSEDRLANFKRVAAALDLPPLKVCYVYFKKHLDAVEYVVNGKKELSETFESRVLDARVYLMLLYALYLEELQNKEDENLINKIAEPMYPTRS